MKSSILIIPDVYYIHGKEDETRRKFELLNPNLIVYFEHELENEYIVYETQNKK
jgi:hypothetical protein